MAMAPLLVEALDEPSGGRLSGGPDLRGEWPRQSIEARAEGVGPGPRRGVLPRQSHRGGERRKRDVEGAEPVTHQVGTTVLEALANLVEHAPDAVPGFEGAGFVDAHEATHEATEQGEGRADD